MQNLLLEHQYELSDLQHLSWIPLFEPMFRLVSSKYFHEFIDGMF